MHDNLRCILGSDFEIPDISYTCSRLCRWRCEVRRIVRHLKRLVRVALGKWDVQALAHFL